MSALWLLISECDAVTTVGSHTEDLGTTYGLLGNDCILGAALIDGLNPRWASNMMGQLGGGENQGVGSGWKNYVMGWEGVFRRLYPSMPPSPCLLCASCLPRVSSVCHMLPLP